MIFSCRKTKYPTSKDIQTFWGNRLESNERRQICGQQLCQQHKARHRWRRRKCYQVCFLPNTVMVFSPLCYHPSDCNILSQIWREREKPSSPRHPSLSVFSQFCNIFYIFDNSDNTYKCWVTAVQCGGGFQRNSRHPPVTEPSYALHRLFYFNLPNLYCIKSQQKQHVAYIIIFPRSLHYWSLNHQTCLLIVCDICFRHLFRDIAY